MRSIDGTCNVTAATAEWKATVEAGFMTKDLAILVGKDQPYLNTQAFLDKIVEGLDGVMKVAA